MTISRRKVLAGLGAGALSLPLLPHLVRAQEAGPPKRFVVFFTPNEPIDKNHWFPTGARHGGPLPARMTPVMSSLEAHREKLVLIGDLRMVTRDRDDFGGGHVGIGHSLTGRINVPYGTGTNDFWAGGISVDQLIARRLGVRALTLGARSGPAIGGARMVYTGRNEPVHPIANPENAFDSVFAGLDLSDSERSRHRSQRQRVLSVIAGGVSRLRSRVPYEQRARLERHLESVQALRATLDEDAVASCSPVAPGSGRDLPTIARRQIDVLVQALACGVTRVGSLQIGNSGGAESYSGPLRWPSEDIDFPYSQHVIAHNYNSDATGSNVTMREAVERVHYETFAYLLEKLDEVDEGSSSLLDNTLVLWTKPIGVNHRGHPMLYMLAGGAGGALRTNRYLSFEDTPHNNLLAACCQLMGLEDVESFGDPDICTGVLPL